MTSTTRLAIFAAFGLASAISCYVLVELLIPEPASGALSVLRDHLPGINFGLFLYAASLQTRVVRHWHHAAGAILVIGAMVSWRLAVIVAIEVDDPYTYPAAGAVGAFVVALSLLWPWAVYQHWLRFSGIVVASGVFGALLYQLVTTVFALSDDIDGMALVVAWQTTVFTGCALAHTCSDRADKP